MIEWLRFLVFAIFGFCIGIVDFKTQKIPNLFLFALAGVLIGCDFLWNPDAIPISLLSGLGAYGLFYAVYRIRGGLGYGDVKYAGIIGYFLGPGLVIYGLLCAVLLGLVYWCAGYLIFRWGKEKRFPFGPWLSCGAVAAKLVYRCIL